MQKLSAVYEENVRAMDETLRIGSSFDLVRRRLRVGADELIFYYVEGMIKSEIMQRMLRYFLSLSHLEGGEDAAAHFMEAHLPYLEARQTDEQAQLVLSTLSGMIAVLGSPFGGRGVIVDARTYPARSVGEPENDKVMQGARDGFVETLLFNTALIRRRIRDPRLTLQYKNIGGASQTDIAICYMEGVADPAYVAKLTELIDRARPQSLSMGTQSLIETLLPRRWFNPFPRVRTTERPDTAAAQLVEGSVLILCDTSPQAIIFPCAIFDFLQATTDYYLPPLTGSYLRVVRLVIFFGSLLLTPTWYLLVRNADLLPAWLQFMLPAEAGSLPILIQLFLAEFALDGLKLASMNTPSVLTNSLSIIGALILGDFAVQVGWLSADVILYMAIVGIAGFVQPNIDLHYAFKFLRMLTLALTGLFNLVGFIVGMLLVPVLICLTKTVDGKRSYLYPLLPWNGRALARLFFRLPKHDFERTPRDP
ncbi:MAG: spore germination protein [Eubacteriales bacterium]